MIKRCFVLIGGCLLLFQAGAFGQVRLDIAVPRRSYVVGEPITATLALQSQSTMPLVFGGEHHNAALFLEIRSSHTGRGAPDRRTVSRDFVLMPRSTYRDVVEVTSIFDFLAGGNYRMSVVVVHAGISYRSPLVVFDVVPGIEMQSFRQMLPGYDDIEVVYSFRYATRAGREDAFMVIESSDGRTFFGTFALGPLLRLYQPMVRARSDGSIVAVHQSGRNRFTRSIFAADRSGAEFVEQRHFRPDGTPMETGR
ncbi:MAG: hypothetical protein ACNA71_02085 [Kiritimatiellia bacterium]